MVKTKIDLHCILDNFCLKRFLIEETMSYIIGQGVGQVGIYVGTYNLTVLGLGSTYQYHYTMKYIFTITLPTYLVTFPPLGQFELLHPPLI